MKSGTNSSAISFTAILLLVGMSFGACSALGVDHPQPQSGPFATVLTDAAIDDGASAEWVDGAERPVANQTFLRQSMWTQTAESGGQLIQYGASSNPGIRHLRIGFKSPLAVGSILVRGGDQLSVLRSQAPYPGNLADESQWIPAQRVFNRQVSSAEVNQDSFALWILPPGTKTRALRFTHTPAASDSRYTSVFCGAYLLSTRLANLAPQAIVNTSANSAAAALLINEKHDSWLAWDNGPTFPHPVNASSPEWIMLTWPHPVSLAGLAALWAGFNAADAQIFSGPDNIDPRNAPDADWRSIGQPIATHNQYPHLLGIDWIDFGKTVTTRAVKLRINQVANEGHPHLIGKTRNGNRVWLGELMALTPLGASDPQTAILPLAADNEPKPPIPVHFTLATPAFVSLVIDDAQGNRVRNLVSDTWFEAGPNTVWWDGTDDLGRNADAALHGTYLIPTHFVAPGKYEVRGITHKAIDLHYEFSVYSAGHPIWDTIDGTGGWLTNHTPASSALYVPAEKAPGGKPLVYLGSYVSEGGSGLAWVDLEGNKQGGRGWIGGAWTAAPYLARDTGTHANPDFYAYVGAAWTDQTATNAKQPIGVIRLTALTPHADKSILNYHFDPGSKLTRDERGRPVWTDQIAGIAVHDNLAVVSLSRQDQLLFADATSGKTFGFLSVTNPRGIAFDARGRLLVLTGTQTGTQLIRYSLPPVTPQFTPQQLPKPEALISEGLEDPVGITLDAGGNIYVSDRGNSNQVKVFSTAGKFLRAIGRVGPSKAGPYDELHMNQPRGLAIDSSNHLWVAEEDFQPKRVSLWTLDGKLLKAFYGPAEYGGGGSLDPTDETKFYYHGMEFKLDWKAGTNSLASVLYRPGKDEIPFPPYSGPTTVLYNNHRRYFTNTFIGHPTFGISTAFLYLETAGILRPVAALGKANDWQLLRTDVFKPKWPQGADLFSNDPKNSVLFSWSDTNNNGKVDPDEVTFLKAFTGSITMMSDATLPGSNLAMYDAIVDGKATRFAPVKVTAEGIPIYDIHKGEVIVDGAQIQSSDGGGQILYSPQATVLTTAPLPFAPQSIGGIDSHGHRWSYPSLWPGLHPAHSAPVADHPGELIGTTRLLGEFVRPAGSTAAPLWGINGNFGDLYLFTADGFYVTQLFQDVRTGKPWNMPVAQRNMLLNDISLHDEDFFPSLTQTPDGNIYVGNGGGVSIVRVDGLGSVQTMQPSTINVTKDQLDQAQRFMQQKEIQRQAQAGKKSLEVTIRSGSALQLNSLIANPQSFNWATVDRRINNVGFADLAASVEAAITIAGGRLYAAFRTTEPNLLVNSGAVANAPFKSGGALDLMIGTNPHANPNRETPVTGDIRLLVYLVQGKPRATLYRAVVPGTTNPVPFSSPDRTITIDKVEDVSGQLQFDASKGDYSFSIPLQTLGLAPAAGDRIKADIGILRGSPVQTSQRVYWSNKATGITSDVPSEAQLTPNLWGEWVFKTAP